MNYMCFPTATVVNTVCWYYICVLYFWTIWTLWLQNGANVTAMDVDGYFPIDQAAENSEAKTILKEHLKQKGNGFVHMEGTQTHVYTPCQQIFWGI